MCLRTAFFKGGDVKPHSMGYIRGVPPILMVGMKKGSEGRREKKREMSMVK